MKQFETILSWTVRLILFAIPFTVLIVVNGTFFPYITGKNFAFRILVEIATALWLILVLFKPSEYLPKRSHILYGLFAFIIVAGISMMVGANSYHSFWSNYERMEGYLGLLHCFAYFITLVSLLREEKYWKWFFNMSLISAILVSLYGLRQHFFGVGVSGQGGARIDGTFGNAIYLAGYATFHFFLSLYLSHKSRFTALKIIYGLVAALFVYVVVLTQTRGAMLGLLAGSGSLLVLGAIRLSGRVRIACIIILATLVLIVGGLYIARSAPIIKNSPLLTRFVSISPSEGTGKARLMIWGMALEGVKEKPIFGWGQENFNLVFNKYYNPEMYAQEQWFDRAHSVLMDWFVATGILGLLAYLSLYAFAFYHLLKPGTIFNKTESMFLVALFAGNFVQNLFVFDNLGGYLTFFMILGYLHVRLAYNPEPDFTNRSQKPQMFRMPVALSIIGSLIVLVGVVYSIRYFNYLPIKQNTSLIKAITFQGTTGLKNNLAYFREAFSYGTFGDTESREQLLQGVFSVATSEQFPQEDRIEYLNFTAEQMEKQIELTPWDARYVFFTGALYRMFGYPEKSLVYLKKAVELSPAKQSMLFELATAHIDLNQYAEAEKIAKETVDLAPGYHNAQVFYIISLLFSGNIKSLENFVSSSPYSEVLMDEKLPPQFTKHGQIGLYQRLVNSVQQKIAKNTNLENSSQNDCSNLFILSQYDRLLNRSDTTYQKLYSQTCS